MYIIILYYTMHKVFYICVLLVIYKILNKLKYLTFYVCF